MRKEREKKQSMLKERLRKQIIKAHSQNYKNHQKMKCKGC